MDPRSQRGGGSHAHQVETLTLAASQTNLPQFPRESLNFYVFISSKVKKE